MNLNEVYETIDQADNDEYSQVQSLAVVGGVEVIRAGENLFIINQNLPAESIKISLAS